MLQSRFRQCLQRINLGDRMHFMVNIVFMGTPEFAVPSLRALMETQQVVGVVTQPDRPAGRGRQLRPSPIKQVALEANIPVYQPKSLKKDEAVAPIAAWQPDLIVVAAFGQILRPNLLDLPPHGCLNVHASLLPRWRGASPIQHAILAGDAKTGVTLMQMDVGLDTGDMFVMEELPIVADETAVSLHDKLAALGAQMLTTHLDDILAGRISPTLQDDDNSTYAPMISKADGVIDWSRSSIEIDRQIRAMTPWPSATTIWDGTLLKIIDAAPVSLNQANYEVGEVVAVGETAVVATGNGGIQLNNIQLAGKRATLVGDFLRGNAQFIGSRLGLEDTL